MLFTQVNLKAEIDVNAVGGCGIAVHVAVIADNTLKSHIISQEIGNATARRKKLRCRFTHLTGYIQPTIIVGVHYLNQGPKPTVADVVPGKRPYAVAYITAFESGTKLTRKAGVRKIDR